MLDLPVEGSLIGGRYLVGELLGMGGMGLVRAARHTTLGHELAIKLMLPDLARKPEAAARFLREARAAVSIGSEHVARVIDVDALPDGTPYIVMERLRGQDLAALLERRGPLPVDEAVGFVLQAAEAVAEAHTLGIVHRDLKPRNLFVAVRPDGELSIKVLDFGIAKATDPVSAITQTQGNVALGSPHYMSPEQVRDPATVDARTDIWSFGVVLYQLTTGTVPFDAEALPALGAAIVGDPHQTLRTRLPEAPEGFSEVVDRCLAKRPAERYADLAELARALEPFGGPSAKKSVARCVKIFEHRAREMDVTQPARMDHETAEMSAPVKRSPDPGTQAGITASTRTESAPPIGSHRRRVALAITAVAAASIAAWYFFGREAKTPSPTPPALASHTGFASALPSQAAPPPEPATAPPPPRATTTEPQPLRGKRIFPQKSPAPSAPVAPSAAPVRDPYQDRK